MLGIEYWLQITGYWVMAYLVYFLKSRLSGYWLIWLIFKKAGYRGTGLFGLFSKKPVRGPVKNTGYWLP